MTSSTSNSDRLFDVPPPYGRTGAAAAVLGLLLPLLLVGGTFALWGRPEANEGPVSEALATCRATMEAKRPEIVVIGNSKADTDVDRALLGAGLSSRVTTTFLRGVGGHVFYAMLERCVLQAPEVPKLVVVYATAGATLRRTVGSDRDREGLEAFDAASLPAVQQKVLGASSGPFWTRVEDRQRAIHTGLAHVVRDAVAGLFFAPSTGDGLLAAGRAYAEPALAAAIGADTVVEVDRSRAIPIADRAERAAVADSPTVAGSFVPDMISAARARGVRLVIVSAPVSDVKTNYDPVDPGLVRELVQTLNTEGVGYIDLSREMTAGSTYVDGVHMGAAGRAAMTGLLVARLRALDALGAGPLPAAPVPRLPPVITRTGTLPTLPAIAPVPAATLCGWKAPLQGFGGLSDTALSKDGRGLASPVLVLEDGAPLRPHANRADVDDSCGGASNHTGNVVKFAPTGGPVDVARQRTYTLAVDPALPLRDAVGAAVWWVYPGTTLHFEIAEPCGAPCSIAVTAHAALSGAGADLRIPGQAPISFALDGTVATALATTTTTGPWSFEIASPAEGPWLYLDRIAVGDLAEPWYALGHAEPSRSISVLASPATFTNAIPLPTLPIGTFKPASGAAWVGSNVVGLTSPDADTVLKVAGLYACAPARVLEDAVALPKQHLSINAMKTGEAGGYVHKTFGFTFSTTDGTSPLENGRRYTVDYDPERSCKSGRWLYPGDRARFVVTHEQLAGLRDNASRLDLAGTLFGAADGALGVRLLVDGSLALDTTLPLASLSRTPTALPLAAPVPATAGEVVLELASPPNAGFVVLSDLTLFEPGRVLARAAP